MNRILINESKLTNIILESINRYLTESFKSNKLSVKRLLQEGFGDDFFNDLNNMVDNPNDYFAADRERDDEEFNRCMDEVSEFTETLSKSYRPEIIIRALQQEVESFEECQSSGEIDEDGERWMSDDDIAGQYGDMKILNFILLPLQRSEGWEGSFELEFPNADGVDYEDYMVNNFIVYDKTGERIAWDNWMPDEQTKQLENIIRQEIMKKGPKI